MIPAKSFHAFLLDLKTARFFSLTLLSVTGFNIARVLQQDPQSFNQIQVNLADLVDFWLFVYLRDL